jgi:hypothetical protein
MRNFLHQLSAIARVAGWHEPVAPFNFIPQRDGYFQFEISKPVIGVPIAVGESIASLGCY